MSEHDSGDPMLDMFLFETAQNLEQLEQLILNTEKASGYSEAAINEIFRIMHTIKGSAAMMEFTNISTLAHKIEDLFFYIRESHLAQYDCGSISDHILASIDFIRSQMEKIQAGEPSVLEANELKTQIIGVLETLKSSAGQPLVSQDKPAVQESAPAAQSASGPEGDLYQAVFYFEDGCEMENIRAFNLVYQLGQIAGDIHHIPEELLENDECIETIRRQGLLISFRSDRPMDEIKHFFAGAVFMKDFELTPLADEKPLLFEADKNAASPVCTGAGQSAETPESKKEAVPDTTRESSTAVSSMISVSVDKLDRLVDLIGEMVIAQAMVVQNPDLEGLHLENFVKSARQLQKVTNEIQDIAMSVRMIPLSTTFQKMNRIVRDMKKKLEKEVNLEIVGESTEVDKNIIDHLSDPLMHLVRNAVDHGIEPPETRRACGKPAAGTVTLSAKNEGRDVLITVKDDGGGMDREKIYQKAYAEGLTAKALSELSDKELYSFIFLPGFSVNKTVTEFSGRGVGMDVVVTNLEKIGGRLDIESAPGAGTAIHIRIPLTMAIIEGMNVRVGQARYTIPINDIKQSFRPNPEDIITDPDKNEMLMVRGSVYPVIRLHKLFGVESDTDDLKQGITIMAESGENVFCIFADELLGQQEVVVKALPGYVKGSKGLAGCTLLGDGRISLILDTGNLTTVRQKRAV